MSASSPHPTSTLHPFRCLLKESVWKVISLRDEVCSSCSECPDENALDLNLFSVFR